MSPLLEANTLRLQTDPCARAELYLVRAKELASGDPLFHDICTAAVDLEPQTGVVDDWEAIDLAFRIHCRR